MAIISDQSIPWRSKVINPAEVGGRCNVFFDTHVVVLHFLESLDPIIIGDFGRGSGIGTSYVSPLIINLDHTSPLKV
jgi:hypothetical protein